MHNCLSNFPKTYAQIAIVRSSRELVFVLRVSDYLASLSSLPLRNHLALSERESFQVLTVEVKLAPLVSQVVILHILVLFLLFGLGDMGGFLHKLLFSEALSPQHKLSMRTEFLHNKLSFLR